MDTIKAVRVNGNEVCWCLDEEKNWIITEHSDLGWLIGMWPQHLIWVDDAKAQATIYKRDRQINAGDEFGGYVYVPELTPGPELHILND